jgi:hypothetical protein
MLSAIMLIVVMLDIVMLKPTEGSTEKVYNIKYLKEKSCCPDFLYLYTIISTAKVYSYNQYRHFRKKMSLKDCLHWQCLRTKPSVTATLDCTCLGHLGQCDTDRIISIYVALPKVAKASKY